MPQQSGNLPAPGFIRIYYRVASVPHVHTINVNPNPDILLPDGYGLTQKDDLTSIAWTAGVDDYVDVLAANFSSGNAVIDYAELWTQEGTDTPVLRGVHAINQAGTGIGANPGTTRLTLSGRATNGAIAKIVLIGVTYPNDSIFPATGTGVPAYDNYVAYLTAAGSIVYARGDAFYGVIRRGITKTDDATRRAILNL